MNQHQINDLNLLYFGFRTVDLMKKAGVGVAAHIRGKNVGILCGRGNNGGDGFVVALELMKKVSVTVYLLCNPKDIKSSAARTYWNQLLENSDSNLSIEIVRTQAQLERCKKKMALHDAYVDAMLGVGLLQKPRNPYALAIKMVNCMKGTKYAVDIPSGHGTSLAFKTDKVLSLHVQKCALPTTVVDIGVHPKYDSYVGPGDVIALHGRNPDSRKGHNGKVLVIAGSKKYHGAAIYSSEAASYFVDLVYVVTEEENRVTFKKASPEFIVSSFATTSFSKKFLKEFDCVIIGPGIADTETMRTICKTVVASKVKCVIDATAFSLIDPQWLHNKCIVTPHANEFKRLFSCVANEKNILRMAKKYSCTIVKKGKVDLVADAQGLYKNFSGNAGMTTGGTGDILAGMIAGFFATHGALEAAKAGTFLNGFVGDYYKGTVYNARRMLEVLPTRYKELIDLRFQRF